MRMLQCQKSAHAGVMFPENSTCPWCEKPAPKVLKLDVPWFLRPNWEGDLFEPTVEQMIEVQNWCRQHGRPWARYRATQLSQPVVRAVQGRQLTMTHRVRFELAPDIIFDHELTSFHANVLANANKSLLRNLLLKFPSMFAATTT